MCGQTQIVYNIAKFVFMLSFYAFLIQQVWISFYLKANNNNIELTQIIAYQAKKQEINQDYIENPASPVDLKKV